MSRLVVAYVATLVAFCAIDFLWLAFVAGDWYRAQVGTLLRDPPNWGAAVVFYLIYIAGVVFFCVRPVLDGDGAQRPLLTGALFGLCAYATYDLTNLATLAGWTLPLAVVDTLWGAVVTAIASQSGASVTRAIIGRR